MNSRHVCYTIPPRPRRQHVTMDTGPVIPAARYNSGSSGDDLRRLALELVQHDPVLAHLLVRAGQRRSGN
jgi:hypothetical protein